MAVEEQDCGCVRKICHCQKGADLWRRLEIALEVARAVSTAGAWRECQEALAAYEAHFGEQEEAA